MASEISAGCGWGPSIPSAYEALKLYKHSFNLADVKSIPSAYEALKPFCGALGSVIVWSIPSAYEALKLKPCVLLSAQISRRSRPPTRH